jgi:hypothetical protein
MRTLLFAAGALAAFAIVMTPTVSRAASAYGSQAQQSWSKMDKCTHQAIDKFPDQTPAALAKRNEYIRNCQREARAPIRQDLPPPAATPQQ